MRGEGGGEEAVHTCESFHATPIHDGKDRTLENSEHTKKIQI